MSLYRPVDIQCLNEHCDLEDVFFFLFVCLLVGCLVLIKAEHSGQSIDSGCGY